MRVATITLFAIATIAASASAASLDVEPIASTTPPSSIANNSTSDHKIGVQSHWCKAMLNANWNDVKYACTWRHQNLLETYYNQFFKRYDGHVVQQCTCDNDLGQYNPWGPQWTISSDTRIITCHSKDGRVASDVKHEFDAYSCG